MSPTSFEDTIRDAQTTAQNLKLPDALRAINELLVRSWGHEIAVEVPIKEAIYLTPRRPRLEGPVDAFGIHLFEYRAQDEHPLSQELALALRYTRVERNPESGNDVRSFGWVPLVPLRGSGAPPVASRRLRVWAGQNLPYLVALLSDAMAKEVQCSAAAASHAEKDRSKKGLG